MTGGFTPTSNIDRVGHLDMKYMTSMHPTIHNTRSSRRGEESKSESRHYNNHSRKYTEKHCHGKSLSGEKAYSRTNCSTGSIKLVRCFATPVAWTQLEHRRVSRCSLPTIRKTIEKSSFNVPMHKTFQCYTCYELSQRRLHQLQT